jgi:hypothetical protein
MKTIHPTRVCFVLLSPCAVLSALDIHIHVPEKTVCRITYTGERILLPISLGQAKIDKSSSKRADEFLQIFAPASIIKGKRPVLPAEEKNLTNAGTRSIRCSYTVTCISPFVLCISPKVYKAGMFAAAIRAQFFAAGNTRRKLGFQCLDRGV